MSALDGQTQINILLRGFGLGGAGSDGTGFVSPFRASGATPGSFARLPDLFDWPGRGNQRQTADLMNSVAGLLRAVADLIEGMGDRRGRGDLGIWPGSRGPSLDQTGNNFAEPGQVIAGSGRIWGDPHFICADGGKYDVQGEAGKTYNLLSDAGFQMNGRFDSWGSGGATVVGEVGINTATDRIQISKSGEVTVNGRALRDGDRVSLGDGGFVEVKGNDVKVKSGEWEVDFQVHKGSHLDMDVRTSNAVADGVRPHGLLGQTFDGDGKARNGDQGAGAQGGGAIETFAHTISAKGDKDTVSLYEVGGLHDTQFHGFNRFRHMNYDHPSMQNLLSNAYGAWAQMLFGAQQSAFASAQPMIQVNNFYA